MNAAHNQDHVEDHMKFVWILLDLFDAIVLVDIRKETEFALVSLCLK